VSDRGRPGGKRDKNLLRTSLGNGHRVVNRSEIGCCKSLAKELEKRIRKGCFFSSFLFFDSASLQALIEDGVFVSFVKSENVRKYALKNGTEIGNGKSGIKRLHRCRPKERMDSNKLGNSFITSLMQSVYYWRKCVERFAVYSVGRLSNYVLHFPRT
jgi:hypothetical protein